MLSSHCAKLRCTRFWQDRSTSRACLNDARQATGMKRRLAHVVAVPQGARVGSDLTNAVANDSMQHAAQPAKKRFQPPASNASGVTASNVPAKANPAPTASMNKAAATAGNVTPAQYYTVLYTKRAANKVCCHCSRAFVDPTIHAMCMCCT